MPETIAVSKIEQDDISVCNGCKYDIPNLDWNVKPCNRCEVSPSKFLPKQKE